MARNVKEIVEQVLDTLIPDESFTGDQVLELVNACALRISRKLVLPALDTTGTVTTLTSAAQVALPTNHQRNLYSCRDSSAPDDFVIIHNDRHEMIRAHGPSFDIKTGTKVLGVSAVKPFLLYSPIPTTPRVLTLRYQKNPVAYVDPENDMFDILPDGFDDIPYYYACWQLYSKIEQGLEGQKVQTKYHQDLYESLMTELGESLKEGVSLPFQYRRTDRWRYWR